MKYIALLRGINVGKEKRVNMKDLKRTFEFLNFENVSAYINSGNIFFETEEKQKDLDKKVKERKGKIKNRIWLRYSNTY